MAARLWRTERCKVLRLACWNAELLCGRKLKLEHFINQQCVYICLLSEIFRNPGQAFWLPSYVCLHTDMMTAVSGTASMVRRSIVHNTVHVPGLTHLEATPIQDTLPGKLMRTLAAYVSPLRSLIGADTTTCFGGGLPGLMAGDFNAKHVVWISRLSTRRGKPLLHFSEKN